MTGKIDLENELQQLAAGRTGGTSCGTLVLDESHRLELELVALDQLACSFQRLALRAPELDTAPASRLQQAAESLSRRLSYLLEPVRPVETDEEACVVQMRSVPPSRDEAGTSYYELTVRRGAIELRRYARSPGQSREPVPATVTREVFFRLVADLVQAAAESKSRRH